MALISFINTAIYVLSDWRTCCFHCSREDELEEEINDEMANIYTEQIYDQKPNRELVENYIDSPSRPTDFI